MSHFPISYSGNKRNEFKHLKSKLNEQMKTCNTVIEPFCGSSAVSFNLWLEHGEKKKYILNDNNPFLIHLYRIIKTGKLEELINELHEIRKTINTKDEHHAFVEGHGRKYSDFNEKNFIKWIYANVFYKLRPGVWDSSGKSKTEWKFQKLKLKFIEFIKSENVIITNEDWKAIFLKHVGDETALFFFDPPYIEANNYGYMCKKTDFYDYFSSDVEMKAKFMAVLGKTPEVAHIFRKYSIFEYDKQYMVADFDGRHKERKPARKTVHIAITNY